MTKSGPSEEASAKDSEADSAPVVQLTVAVSRETYSALTTMAGEQGKAMPTVIRDAIGVAYAIHSELMSGGLIVVEPRVAPMRTRLERPVARAKGVTAPSSAGRVYRVPL